jgi:hypothetical protein
VFFSNPWYSFFFYNSITSNSAFILHGLLCVTICVFFVCLVFKIHLLICAYIVWAISFPCPWPPPSPLIPLASRQNLFCPLLEFCWRENIRDDKKDIAFLLDWDKDSYTERFLALLPCTCVLQPKLVHLYQTSSPLPSQLPIMASVSLRLLYSLFYSEHIKYFQVLGFLPFPYSSCTCSPLSMW